MKIRIPKALALAWDLLIDGLAVALLPPPIPIGIRVAGGDVTLTELGVVAWGAVWSAALVWYTGNWWGPVAVFGTLFAGYVWIWPFAPPKRGEPQ